MANLGHYVLDKSSFLGWDQNCSMPETKFGKPMMHAKERALLESVVAPLGSEANYWEWGSGGSTGFVRQYFDGSMYSVENHGIFCKRMITDPLIQCAIAQGTLTYTCVAPVTTKSLGKIKDREENILFKPYVFAMDSHPQKQFDVVLVDGRFRVACAMAAFEHLAPNAVVLMHDYKRRPYWKIKMFYHVVGVTDTLALLRPREMSPPTREQILDRMLKEWV